MNDTWAVEKVKKIRIMTDTAAIKTKEEYNHYIKLKTGLTYGYTRVGYEHWFLNDLHCQVDWHLGIVYLWQII